MYKTFASGNLTADARTFDYSGKSATQFTIGSKTSTKNDKGEYISNFISVAVFGPQANSCARLKKGDKVTVIGDTCVQPYTTRDGKQGYNINVRADSVDFMSPPKQEPDIFGN